MNRSLVTALLLAAGCGRTHGPAPRAAPPNVLLVTVDTLRPDALGWVTGGGGSPAIDALAREGFRFPAAVAPVPLTLPSHAALLTGRLPRQLGLRDNGQVVGETPALAPALRSRGYSTAAFVSGWPLAAPFGLDRGFDVYDDAFTAGGGEREPERAARDTTAAARAWLAQARGPFFLWVHYYEPHFPYEPPPEWRRPGPRGAYDGEVAAADAAFGELRAAVTGDTLTVFTADHGESLGEHGEGTHGFFLYDSTVLVPLVLHWPGRVRPGESRAAARLVDVAPTILDLLGLPAWREHDGRSLVPILEGRSGAVPAALLETWQPWTSYGWAPLAALRLEGWKLIEAPRPELYDLARDPSEARDRHGEAPAKARELREILQRVKPAAAAARPVVEDAQAVEALRALGYVGAGTAASDPPPVGLRDPKDGAALRERLTRGDQAMRAGRLAEAVRSFDAVLREDPENRFALLRSGVAWLRLKQPSRALPRLEAAVALQPDHAECWSHLGTALGLSGRPAEAVAAFRRAVSLRPRDPGLLTRLAFAQHAAGDVAGAAARLQEAARLGRPGTFAHSGALGILLVQLGRPDAARPWLAASRPAEGDFAQAQLELARLEAAAGRDDAAANALREALAASPALRGTARADPRLSRLLAASP